MGEKCEAIFNVLAELCVGMVLRSHPHHRAHLVRPTALSTCASTQDTIKEHVEDAMGGAYRTLPQSSQQPGSSSDCADPITTV